MPPPGAWCRLGWFCSGGRKIVLTRAFHASALIFKRNNLRERSRCWFEIVPLNLADLFAPTSELLPLAGSGRQSGKLGSGRAVKDVSSRARRTEEIVGSLFYLSSTSGVPACQQVTRIFRCLQNQNAMLRVAGVLLYSPSSFTHFSGGEQEMVARLYRGLRQEHRHDGVATLLCGLKRVREFHRWLTAFRESCHPALSAPVGFRPFETPDVGGSARGRLARD